MRGIRQWMSDNGEVAGILVFVLVVVIIGGGSYGISYAAGGGSGKKNAASLPPLETLAEGNQPETQEGSQPETQSGEGNAPEIKPVETESQPEPPQGGQTGQDGESEGSPDTSAASGGNGPEGGAQGDTFTEYGVHFQSVDEQVTAKIETNLRRVPSTEKDEDVVTKIYNGDWVRRTGIGHNGWSRVEYEGQVLYAVTSYLSADGSTSSLPTYEEASDSVTAKEEVYLRSAPDSSTDDNVVATLHNGEFVARTGIGSNGWSRLDYNGTEVYAVTSLLITE